MDWLSKLSGPDCSGLQQLDFLEKVQQEQKSLGNANEGEIVIFASSGQQKEGGKKALQALTQDDDDDDDFFKSFAVKDDSDEESDGKGTIPEGADDERVSHEVDSVCNEATRAAPTLVKDILGGSKFGENDKHRRKFLFSDGTGTTADPKQVIYAENSHVDGHDGEPAATSIQNNHLTPLKNITDTHLPTLTSMDVQPMERDEGDLKDTQNLAVINHVADPIPIQQTAVLGLGPQKGPQNTPTRTHDNPDVPPCAPASITTESHRCFTDSGLQTHCTTSHDPMILDENLPPPQDKTSSVQISSESLASQELPVAGPSEAGNIPQEVKEQLGLASPPSKNNNMYEDDALQISANARMNGKSSPHMISTPTSLASWSLPAPANASADNDGDATMYARDEAAMDCVCEPLHGAPQSPSATLIGAVSGTRQKLLCSIANFKCSKSGLGPASSMANETGAGPWNTTEKDAIMTIASSETPNCNFSPCTTKESLAEQTSCESPKDPKHTEQSRGLGNPVSSMTNEVNRESVPSSPMVRQTASLMPHSLTPEINFEGMVQKQQMVRQQNQGPDWPDQKRGQRELCAGGSAMEANAHAPVAYRDNRTNMHGARTLAPRHSPAKPAIGQGFQSPLAVANRPKRASGTSRIQALLAKSSPASQNAAQAGPHPMMQRKSIGETQHPSLPFNIAAPPMRHLGQKEVTNISLLARSTTSIQRHNGFLLKPRQDTTKLRPTVNSAQPAIATPLESSIPLEKRPNVMTQTPRCGLNPEHSASATTLQITAQAHATHKKTHDPAQSKASGTNPLAALVPVIDTATVTRSSFALQPSPESCMVMSMASDIVPTSMQIEIPDNSHGIGPLQSTTSRRTAMKCESRATARSATTQLAAETQKLTQMLVDVQQLETEALELHVRLAVHGNRLARLDNPIMLDAFKRLKQEADKFMVKEE